MKIQKAVLFPAVLLVFSLLCSCGNPENTAVTDPAPSTFSSDAPVDEIAEHLDPTAAYACETEDYLSIIRFDPSSHLIEGFDGPPDSDNLIFFKGTYSLDGRKLEITHQFLYGASFRTVTNSYSVRFLVDGISLTPLGYTDGIFQDGAAGSKDFILSSDWTASSLHELCTSAEQSYNNGEYDVSDQNDPLHVADKLRVMIAEPKVWSFSHDGDTIYLSFLNSDMFFAYRFREDGSPAYSLYGNYEISGRELTFFYDISSHPESMPIDTYTFAVSDSAFYLWYSQGDYAPLGDKQRQARRFQADDTLTPSELWGVVETIFEEDTTEYDDYDTDLYYGEEDETLVYITNTGERYHRATCSSLSHSSYEVTLLEAVDAGYTPCQNCHPPAK